MPKTLLAQGPPLVLLLQSGDPFLHVLLVEPVFYVIGLAKQGGPLFYLLVVYLLYSLSDPLFDHLTLQLIAKLSPLRIDLQKRVVSEATLHLNHMKDIEVHELSYELT